MTNPVNFFSLTLPELKQFFADLGEKPFRATQLMKWVYHHGVTDIGQMTDLSKVLRERLVNLLEFKLPEIESELISHDGTRKW